jgi:hypothetical protein
VAEALSVIACPGLYRGRYSAMRWPSLSVRDDAGGGAERHLGGYYLLVG